MKYTTRQPSSYGSTRINDEGEIIESGPYEYHEPSKHMQAESWEYMPETNVESKLSEERQSELRSEGYSFNIYSEKWVKWEGSVARFKDDN